MKKLLVLVAILLVLVTACSPGKDIEVNVPSTTIQLTTPGPNPQLNEPDANGRIAGLGLGLWHGVIAPVSRVGSFFNEKMQMDEVHNNGNQYILGFLLGVALVFLMLGLFGGRWR